MNSHGVLVSLCTLRAICHKSQTIRLQIWYDYGYRASTAAWVAEDKGWVPGTLLAVGTKNFRRELASLIGSRRAVTDTDPSAKAMRLELEKLR